MPERNESFCERKQFGPKGLIDQPVVVDHFETSATTYARANAS